VFHPDYILFLQDNEPLVSWIGHINFVPLCRTLLSSTANEIAINYSPDLGIRPFKVVIYLGL
jgi:hypothetical protein